MVVAVLVCSSCARHHDPSSPQGTCLACGSPLLSEYDLKPGDLNLPLPADRPHSLWRYAEVLPAASGVGPDAGWTPLVRVEERVWIKDESSNPTGSFKDRGMAVAVTMALHLGARALAAPSAGNAAVALAVYGEAAGLPVTVALPADTPPRFAAAARRHGAEVHLVPGDIGDAGRFLADRLPAEAVDLATLREPYRIEGKKTMAYELWEQLGGTQPGVIVYPTGGGTGLIGMWRAFDEMERLGLIGRERPRLVSAQVAGCAPVAAAFSGEESPSPVVSATGLRVPQPLGLELCLEAVYSTRGTALAIAESEMWRAAGDLAAATGIDAGPETGAAWAAQRTLRESGFIAPDEVSIVFNTGSMASYRR